MSTDMTGDDWLALAKSRVETAKVELGYASLVAGPTKSSLVRIYGELEAACQHLLDAGFAYGIGDLR